MTFILIKLVLRLLFSCY